MGQAEYTYMSVSINPFANNIWFLRVCSTKLLKTLWEKEKLLKISIFFLFSQCFLPVWKAVCLFHQIHNCRLQTLEVLKSLKLVVWEGVKKRETEQMLCSL